MQSLPNGKIGNVQNAVHRIPVASTNVALAPTMLNTTSYLQIPGNVYNVYMVEASGWKTTIVPVAPIPNLISQNNSLRENQKALQDSVDPPCGSQFYQLLCHHQLNLNHNTIQSKILNKDIVSSKYHFFL